MYPFRAAEVLTPSDSKDGPSSTPSRVFRQRLLGDPPEDPQEAPEAPTADRNKVFFDRLSAYFWIPDEAPTLDPNEREPAPSLPSPPSTLISDLQENYARAGYNLIKNITAQLAKAQASMEENLANIVSGDAASLATLTEYAKRLSGPLSDCKIKLRSPAASQKRTKVISVDELVSQFCHQLATAEAELQELRDGWTEDQAKIKAVVREIQGSGVPKGSPAEEVITSCHASVEKELEAAEAEALEEIKACEAEFKQLIAGEQNSLMMNMISLKSEYD